MWHVLIISSLFFVSATSGFASNSSEDKTLSLASLQLLEAAYTGSTSGVIQALQNGADINAKASHDDLKSLGNDKDIPYSFPGNTPIVLAVSNNHVKVAKILLEHGADANSKSKMNEYMLNRAASEENVAMVKILLQHGAVVAISGVLYSVVLFSNNLEIVKLLLQYGANPNDGSEYCRILGCAVREGNPKIVQALLQHGADPNSEENSDGPALYIAAYEGAIKRYGPAERRPSMLMSLVQDRHRHKYAKIMRLLLDSGADPNASDWLGETPLMVCAKLGFKRGVELLLANGANPKAIDKNGDTPLDLAMDSLEGAPKWQVKRLEKIVRILKSVSE